MASLVYFRPLGGRANRRVGGTIVRLRAIDIDGTQVRGAAAGAAIGAVPVQELDRRVSESDAILP